MCVCRRYRELEERHRRKMRQENILQSISPENIEVLETDQNNTGTVLELLPFRNKSGRGRFVRKQAYPAIIMDSNRFNSPRSISGTVRSTISAPDFERNDNKRNTQKNPAAWNSLPLIKPRMSRPSEGILRIHIHDDQGYTSQNNITHSQPTGSGYSSPLRHQVPLREVFVTRPQQQGQPNGIYRRNAKTNIADKQSDGTTKQLWIDGPVYAKVKKTRSTGTTNAAVHSSAE